MRAVAMLASPIRFGPDLAHSVDALDGSAQLPCRAGRSAVHEDVARPPRDIDRGAGDDHCDDQCGHGVRPRQADGHPDQADQHRKGGEHISQAIGRIGSQRFAISGSAHPAQDPGAPRFDDEGRDQKGKCVAGGIHGAAA
jgi:hypothetical protein